MPDQGSAADEHAILQEITGPLARLPDDPLPLAADVSFPRALRGYDPLAVDAYVKKTSQLVAELQATRTPESAVRRALERVGEQISGILQRAHETAEQITRQSRSEAEDRLEAARQEAANTLEVARQEATRRAAAVEDRLRQLDSDTDRIWAERHRIVEDARELAAQLISLADAAAEQFPPAEEASSAGKASKPEEPDADAKDEAAGEEDDGATAVLPPVKPKRQPPKPSDDSPKT
jgi:cell division septum initiation protein DivIVA